MNLKQQQLFDFFTAGNKLTQSNNRLWMDGEIINTKTFQAVMRRIHPDNWVKHVNKYVTIK